MSNSFLFSFRPLFYLRLWRLCRKTSVASIAFFAQAKCSIFNVHAYSLRFDAQSIKHNNITDNNEMNYAFG